MATRKSVALWKGTIQDGQGSMTSGSGAFELPFTFGTRFEQDGGGTNPEELLGAAHAGCYSMALSKMLGDAGFTPESIETAAHVRLEKKEGAPAITGIELVTQASVPEIDSGKFEEIAAQAKDGCLVSQVLDRSIIQLKATLV